MDHQSTETGMNSSSDDLPADFESLNRSFYRENGPGEFILMRLYALCVIGGSYDRFKDILADGVDFAKLQLGWTLVEDDDPDGLLEQADEAFRQHFLRIETHHLKHLAIETLLRMFLGTEGFRRVHGMRCRPLQISGSSKMPYGSPLLKLIRKIFNRGYWTSCWDAQAI